jgi:hypothetical protein
MIYHSTSGQLIEIIFAPVLARLARPARLAAY